MHANQTTSKMSKTTDKMPAKDAVFALPMGVPKLTTMFWK